MELYDTAKLLAEMEMQRRVERVVEPIFFVDMILNIHDNRALSETPLTQGEETPATHTTSDKDRFINKSTSPEEEDDDSSE